MRAQFTVDTDGMHFRKAAEEMHPTKIKTKGVAGKLDIVPDKRILFVVFSLSRARYVWLSRFFSLCPCRSRTTKNLLRDHKITVQFPKPTSPLNSFT